MQRQAEGRGLRQTSQQVQSGRMRERERERGANCTNCAHFRAILIGMQVRMGQVRVGVAVAAASGQKLKAHLQLLPLLNENAFPGWKSV